MQRKPTKNTRGPNADEKRYIGLIKEAGTCCTCGSCRGVIAHHCEGATFKHNKVLVGHWFVIPLCDTCDSVVTHGSRRRFIETFGPQSALWFATINALDVQVPHEVKEAILDWGR